LATWWDVLRDYAKRVWNSSGEDDIFFLASGIAFNIMLAAVPFVFLVISGLVYALGLTPDASLAEVSILLDRFLPPHPETPDSSVHRLIGDIIGAREQLGIYGAVTFIWFSTRLFGSLRTVLAEIFDIETERGVIGGKLFDIKMTVYSSALLVAYLVINVYLAVATTRGQTFLTDLGLREDVMGGLEYVIGRLIAFLFLSLTFFALYKYLPNRRIRVQQALVGALSTAFLFEAARNVWTAYTRSFDPGSLYTGTIYALVSLVFWVYYSALIFIIGGEVAQVHELRRVRRLQRETFET
ncbi:MAG: YihY/virulence factor BrkB family protein, partial [Gemmatimonadaceae bacterium]